MDIPVNGSPQEPAEDKKAHLTVLDWLHSGYTQPKTGRNMTVLQRMCELWARNMNSFKAVIYSQVKPEPKHPYGSIGLTVGEAMELQFLHGMLSGFANAEDKKNSAEVNKLVAEELERAKTGIYLSPAKRILVPR